MRVVKLVLILSLMLFAGVLSVSAQSRDREDNSGSNIMLVDRTQGTDCNNLVIDDD